MGAQCVRHDLQLVVEAHLAHGRGLAQVVGLQVLHVVVQRAVGAHAVLGLAITAEQQGAQAAFVQQLLCLLLECGGVG